MREPLDLVSEVLDLVRLNGAIFFRSDMYAPWAYHSPPTLELEGVLPRGTGSLVKFHIVAEGACWIALDDGPRHQLRTGDVVVLPYADAHSFGSLAPAEPVPIQDLLAPRPWRGFPEIKIEGEGERTQMVCGYLRGDALLFDPVLRALPPLFVVRPTGSAAAWVKATVDFGLGAEGDPSPSRARQGQRLAELLFTEVLGLYLSSGVEVEVTGWLAALRDPVVGRALVLLHQDPAQDWTVDGLARASATSRSVLMERFDAMLGRPPIRYLTDWRLDLASGLLRTTGLTVAQIAGRVGYGSEDAFSRAFKRRFGTAPAHWRAEAA
ncbi:MAG TPA: AraC family transcriptional regulator [Sporichthya sp.]|nr:AraC family transcriptional regulator [Sporichthya sp.]